MKGTGSPSTPADKGASAGSTSAATNANGPNGKGAAAQFGKQNASTQKGQSQGQNQNQWYGNGQMGDAS